MRIDGSQFSAGDQLFINAMIKATAMAFQNNRKMRRYYSKIANKFTPNSISIFLKPQDKNALYHVIVLSLKLLMDEYNKQETTEEKKEELLKNISKINNIKKILEK